MSKQKILRAVVSDFFGTLYHGEHDNAVIVNEVLGTHPFLLNHYAVTGVTPEPLSDDEMRKVNQSGVINIFWEAYGKRGLPTDVSDDVERSIEEAVVAAFEKHVYAKERVHADARDAIERLIDNGVSVAISLGEPPSRARSLIDQTGINAAVFVAANELTTKDGGTISAKFSDTHLADIARELGCTLDEIAYIGDGPKDERMATHAGVPLVKVIRDRVIEPVRKEESVARTLGQAAFIGSVEATLAARERFTATFSPTSKKQTVFEVESLDQLEPALRGLGFTDFPKAPIFSPVVVRKTAENV